jgi:hypothetical protein
VLLDLGCLKNVRVLDGGNFGAIHTSVFSPCDTTSEFEEDVDRFFSFASSSSSSTPYSSCAVPKYPAGKRNAPDLFFGNEGRESSAFSESNCGIATSINLMIDLYFVSEKFNCRVGSWPETLNRARLYAVGTIEFCTRKSMLTRSIK